MKKLHGHSLVLAPHIGTLQNIGFASVGRVLPSTGMTVDQMAHVLTSLGFGTLVYDKHVLDIPLNVFALAAPYIASGIPVVLATENHAVTACGGVLRRNRCAVAVESSTKIVATHNWLDGLVIQDDASGPYRVLPRDKTTANRLADDGLKDLLVSDAEGSTNDWCTTKDICALLVPLPPKVYLTAAHAWYLVEQYTVGDGFEQFFRSRIELFDDVDDARLLLQARMGAHGGLVCSLRCRRSIDVRREFAQTSHPESSARYLLHETSLPRLLWVAEITTREAYQQNDADRRVLCELYIDATARPGVSTAALLFARFPGASFARPAVSLPLGDPEIVARRDREWCPIERSNIPFWSDKFVQMAPTRNTTEPPPFGGAKETARELVQL